MKKTSLMRILSTVIATVMMATSLIPVNAAHDGYVEEKEIAYSNVIVDVTKGTSVPLSDDYARNSEYSVKWSTDGKIGKLSFPKVEENDWSKFVRIEFDVYSTAATGAVVAMTFNSPKSAEGKTRLYRINFKVDFEGWKTISIDFSEAATSSVLPEKTNIVGATFYVDGSYSSVPAEGGELYINPIIGYRDPYAEDMPTTKELSIVPEDIQKEMYELLEGDTAVMAFANYAIIKGKKVPVAKEDKITTDENGNIAPLSFYENVLGAKVAKNGDKVSITYGASTVNVGNLVVEYNGIKYLPIDETMAAFGKKSATFDQVTFIGNLEGVADFKDSKSNMLYLKAMLCNTLMKDRNITSEDWEYVRDKWKSFLVGDENNDINNPEIAKKLTSIDNACKSARDKLNRDPNVRNVFGETDIKETVTMTSAYARIEEMAKAYATYGSKYYKDPTLLADIIFALDSGYEKFYSMEEFNGTGWKKAYVDFNWWDWYNGVPVQLYEILIILDDDITKAQIDKWIEAPRAVYKSYRHGENNAASRTHVGTLLAVVSEDLGMMQDLVVDYNYMLYGNSEDSGNVMEDGLYITHGYYAYTAQYGVAALLDRMMDVITILEDTAFEITTPLKYKPMNWMVDTFAPVMFNGFMTSTMMGREPGMETGMNAYAISAAVDLYGTYGIEDDAKLKQIIGRNFNSKNASSTLGNLSIVRYMKLLEILEEDIEVDPYVRSKTYYTGDALTHQVDDWGVALQMSSTRIAGWECINGQNIRGWYHGDGRLLTYTDEDPYNYNKTYWNYANPYMIPGITSDDQERVPASIKSSKKLLSKQDFAGMSNMDELYSTAAMQLETHNWLTEGGNIIIDGAGADAPYHKSSTMAKKAWFMFDDEVVALGTDIHEEDGHEVHTVLDNKRLNKTELKVDKTEDSDGKAYEVVSVTASEDDGNVPQNMLDDDTSTRWSAQGNQWAVFELKEPVPIGYLGIAMYYSTLPGKVALFDLETSMDGVNWTQVYSGQNTGTTKSMEAFDMKGTVAKYVRFNGHGREKAGTGWNSVTEVKIYAPTADGSMPVGGQINENLIYGSETITVDGTALEKASEFKKNFTNPKWFHIEDYAGYYLPEGGELLMNKVQNETYNFLEVWVTHGISPKNGTYAYVLMPKKTAEETKVYSENPDIKIHSNSPELQVVEETTLGVKGLVFWKAGTFEDITTSEPMIIMTKKQDKEYKVNIADPTQKLEQATVTVAGKWKVKEADDRCTAKVVGDNTIIELDMIHSRGRHLPVTLIAQ